MTLLQAEPALSRAERVALCALRRAVGGQAGAAPGGVTVRASWAAMTCLQ